MPTTAHPRALCLACETEAPLTGDHFGCFSWWLGWWIATPAALLAIAAQLPALVAVVMLGLAFLTVGRRRGVARCPACDSADLIPADSPRATRVRGNARLSAQGAPDVKP